jgi:hypothetical protein
MDHRSWNGISGTIDEAGEMTEFAAMTGPIEAQAGTWEPDRSAIRPVEGSRGHPTLILMVFALLPPGPALA